MGRWNMMKVKMKHDVQDKNNKGLEGPGIYDVRSGDDYDVRSCDWSK